MILNFYDFILFRYMICRKLALSNVSLWSYSNNLFITVICKNHLHSNENEDLLFYFGWIASLNVCAFNPKIYVAYLVWDH